MSEEQRKEEIIKCFKEIINVKEAIRLYKHSFDQICYNYEKHYIDARLKLKEHIENKSKILAFLTAKHSALINPAIDMRSIEVNELDTYIKNKNLNTEKIRMSNS
jgi:hypothetical protein